MSTATIGTVDRYFASSASPSPERRSSARQIFTGMSSSETVRKTRSGKSIVLAQPVGDRESFAAFWNDILSLEIDEDEAAISNFAMDVALYTIGRACSDLGDKWRKPLVTTDGTGGLRLTWRVGAKELRAVIPANANRSQYIYFEQGETHDVIKNFTSLTMSERFNWLCSANG